MTPLEQANKKVAERAEAVTNTLQWAEFVEALAERRAIVLEAEDVSLEAAHISKLM